MDIFQQLQKKLSSSEMKFRNCRLSKAIRQKVAHTPPAQPVVPISEEWDAGIVVSRPPPIIRLVLFKESGDCDRPILFDSKCWEKIQPIVQTGSTGTEKYQCIRTSSDSKKLSEMLFGSVGMTQKAASLKIHALKSPPSVMLSRVFCLSPKECATAVSLDRAVENSMEFQRAIMISSRRKANTMPVPLSTSMSRTVTPSQSLASSYSSQSGGYFPRSDSGVSLTSMASSSYQPSTPTYHTGSTSSASALLSSGSHGKSHSLPQSNKRDSFAVFDEFLPHEKLQRRTRTKIGFAVICVPEPTNLAEFQRFFFEHFPIIESHMTALKENIEKALRLRGNFIDLMMKALDEFTAKLHHIYSSQRLPEPVWSTLNTPQLFPKHRRLVIDSFISDLSRLVSDYNTKQRNYFVTNLLTAVLTYHLGWVSSVSPRQIKDEYDQEDEYNALWAQLGDLYGAVGSPTKVCRTVVTGSCHELVSTFLSVLSYFIRSSRVDDVIEVPSSITPYTMGVEDPPPMLKVSVENVPCDMDDDDDYILISVVEDDKKSEAKEKSSSMQSSQSPNKTPVLRSKSSPQKPKRIVEDENEEEPSSLTRSYSGPMIRRSSTRPRSNAISEHRLSTRHRTFSNNMLKRPRKVQSRRRSHDTSDVSMTSKSGPHHSHSRTPETDITETNTGTCLKNIQGSFCMRQCCNMTEFNETSEKDHFSDSNEPDSFTELEIRRAQSSTDIIEPRVERVVNVQRSAVVAERPTDLFFPEKIDFLASKTKTTSDSTSSPLLNKLKPLIYDNENVLENADSIKNTKDSPTSPQNNTSRKGSKTKLTERRRPLPQLSEDNLNKTTSKSNFSAASQPPMNQNHKPKYLRIPSVEMNHKAFEEYFDNDSSIPEEVNDIPSFVGKNTDKTTFAPSNPTHHVTSCPNFTSLQGKSNLFNGSTSKVQSIYPSLDLNEASRPTSDPTAHTQPKTERLYPSLPPDTPFDSVTFHANSERVSFNRQNSNTIDLPSPNLPPNPPTPSRMSSVTVTDDPFLNEELKELPLADITYTEPKRMISEDMPSSPTGFSSLMADYGQEYMNDFILQGAPNQGEMHKKIMADLEHGFKNSTLDEPISESVCIVADTDSCSVKVYRSHRLHEDPPCLPALTSKLIGNILNRISTMAKMKISSEFCMTQLESELRQLVLKSHVLAEYTQGRKRITMAQLSAALNIESRDLPLLMSIASCHSPHVALMML